MRPPCRGTSHDGEKYSPLHIVEFHWHLSIKFPFNRHLVLSVTYETQGTGHTGVQDSNPPLDEPRESQAEREPQTAEVPPKGDGPALWPSLPLLPSFFLLPSPLPTWSGHVATIVQCDLRRPVSQHRPAWLLSSHLDLGPCSGLRPCLALTYSSGPRCALTLSPGLVANGNSRP